MAMVKAEDARDVGLLLLRVGLAAGLLTHGWGKFLKVLSGNFQFADPLGIGAAPSLVLAAGAELGCALLVLVGLWTRWAAIPIGINMAVAAFVAHAGHPFARRELALVYLVGFLALAFTGGGRFGLDRAFRRRRGA